MIERRVTLADVARKAGVHVTTVSLALRDHPRLPEATRARLKALAVKMGYRPDPMLRALVAYRDKSAGRKSPPTLAYVTNWNTRWGWKEVTAHPEFYAGAKTAADALGFRLEHFWMREPGQTQGRLSRILYSRGINGLIIASHGREMGDALLFDWENFSAVKIDYFPHQPELHNVTNDQLQVIRLAMQQVMAAGYRRIGFVMDAGWDITVDNLWQTGFLWEQQKLPARDRIPAYLLPNPVPLADWMRKHKPQVVISKAEFVRPQFADLGLRVPQDVAFVDIFLEELDGEVAGVRQNHATVGSLALEILAGQLQHGKFGVPAIPTTTLVEGTWLDGKTCPPKV